VQRPLERLADDVAERVERRLPPALEEGALLLARAAHVHHLDRRQPSAADAVRQREEPVLARGGVHPRLEARRRAAEDDARPLEPRADHRHLARVVARALSLLVARLVLLVDDDRAEIAQRREDRRARADGDALLAAPQRQPGVVALAVAQRGVEHGDTVAEDGAKAVDGLRRERDLRNEHDRRLPLHLDDVAQELEVDERLPAPRHAVQEEDLPGIAGDGRVDRRALLVGRTVRPAAPRAAEERIAGDDFLLEDDEPASDESAQHRRREVELLEQMLDRASPAQRFEELEERTLLLRAREDRVATLERRQLARDDGDAARLDGRRRRRRAGQRGGERAAQRDAERHDVIVGDPPAQLEHRRIESRLAVGRGEYRAHPGRGHGGRVALTDADADFTTAAQRHDDARARENGVREVVGGAVGEGLKQG
jgi:hypothetical protein